MRLPVEWLSKPVSDGYAQSALMGVRLTPQRQHELKLYFKVKDKRNRRFARRQAESLRHVKAKAKDPLC